MPEIPRTPAFDSTLALFREGYEFIPRRCRLLGADLFETRLMLRKVVCMSGPPAAEAFYAKGRFTRQGAMPRSVVRLLQDRGSVQSLDGAAHRHRKAMFMSLMTPGHVAALRDMFADSWCARMQASATADDSVVLLEAAQESLCEAACDWTGLSVDRKRLPEWTRALVAMIDSAARIGPRNWWASWLRIGAERRLHDVVLRVRSGALAVPEDSALHRMAFHRDSDGQPLEAEIVAVELLNLLRPIVAVANYIVFAALALHENPGWRRRLAAGDDALREHFVQEVRRFYPFFPFVAGRVTEPFSWHGHRFARGDWVILDLYGTNHDPRCWTDPDRFRPERFSDWSGNAFSFIPQGGGDPETGHRCPGDPVAVELAKAAVALMAGSIEYRVPDQDLGFDLADMPAVPRSGFVIRNVRIVGGVGTGTLAKDLRS